MLLILIVLSSLVVKYDVMVYTGKKRGAGTDANVCMTIFGERGDTGSRQLRSSKTNKNKFENGKVCTQISYFTLLENVLIFCSILESNGFSEFW